MKGIYSKLKKLLPGVQKNILLKNYTTFRIGGRAKYFFVAKTKEEIIKAVLAAKKYSLPFFILGGGSNLLVADKGYKGLVINFQFSNFKFQKNKIIAGAGVPLGKLVGTSVDKGLTGLEWAIGIPGTIGGAIYGNVGAFNHSVADIVKSVEVFDITESRIMNYGLRDCKLGYRDSIFKKKRNQSTKQSFVLGRAPKHIKDLCARCSDLIILSAELQLRRGKKEEIEKKIKKYLKYKKEKQPLNLPSAGSIFKNFTPHQPRPQNWGRGGAGPALKTVLEKFSRKDMIPVAYLIDKCGLKGKRIGGAKISDKHVNFIVNLGGARAKDVKRLINLVKQKVKRKFGIVLEEEIVILSEAKKNDPAI